jgi:predicted small secreted protein
MITQKHRFWLCMGLLLALAACGTVEGIGRDISGASNRASRWF